MKVYNKLKDYENEMRLIKIHNDNLANRIKKLEKNKENEVKIMKSDKLHDFREKRIISLESSIKSKNKEIENIKFIARRLNNKISDINNFHVLKKLDTLGFQEFSYKNKVLNIKKNDLLLVEDPNIISNEVVELLRDKIFIIIYNKPLSPKIENIMPFVFIDAKNLKIEEDKYFGFVDKKQLEMERNKAGWINKVISDYKYEKRNLVPR